MALVTIKFVCPTYVVVDTDTNDIDRVVVDDVDLDETPRGYFDPDGNAILDEVSIARAWRAYKLADANGIDWPAWEFGW